MTPRSHVAVQHGHLPFIFPFSTSWLTSHLVCEINQILLDIYLAYSWYIQVQASDWIEYSRYMIGIWQYKLDIWPLVLYIWHIPYIWLLQKYWGHHVTPYVLNTYYIYLHQVSVCHIYGVTWWPPYLVEVVYKAYVRYIEPVGICQAYARYISYIYWHIIWIIHIKLVVIYQAYVR
jgi:hypothetical protein